MTDFLLLKLQGPMQAWGEHSFEGLRPAAFIPTRSALLGLLGACLGVRREDRTGLEQLEAGIHLAVRVDQRQPEGFDKPLVTQKLLDYHTVKNARQEYSGLKSHETIQTWREYLSDCEFSIVLWLAETSVLSMGELEQAVKQPRFTPYLGRRSCPLGRPLFASRCSAKDEFAALATLEPARGVIYTETRPLEGQKVRTLKMRDVPLTRQSRQFASRLVYEYGGMDV